MHEQTETVVYRDIIVLLTLVSLSLSLSLDRHSITQTQLSHLLFSFCIHIIDHLTEHHLMFPIYLQ